MQRLNFEHFFHIETVVCTVQQIYFFGSSFFSSGFGVGSLYESGVLFVPGPTCYLKSMKFLYYTMDLILPPMLLCLPRSFWMPESILEVRPRFSSSLRHISTQYSPSTGSPFAMGVHQTHNRSWFVGDQGDPWRKRQTCHKPHVHTNSRRHTSLWYWQLETPRPHMSWLWFSSCVAR